MATKKTEAKTKRVVVYTRNPDDTEERFVIVSANGTPKRVPFETPVNLTDAEINALKRMRIPVQVSAQNNPKEISDKYGVTQQVAAKMARIYDQENKKELRFVSRFIVSPA